MTTLTEREWQQEMERLRSRQRALVGRMVAMGSYLNEDETTRWDELSMQGYDCMAQINQILFQFGVKMRPSA